MPDNLNYEGQKRALLINDMSCFGNCSLTVAMPIIAHYGVECVPMPTVILPCHTGGLGEVTKLDMTDKMVEYADKFEELGLKFDAIYSGYLGNARQIDVTIDIIERLGAGAFVVVDPVMGDNGKLYSGFDDSYAQKIMKLCSRANVITPNYTEACLLSGCEYGTSPKIIAEKLDVENVIITGCVDDNGIGIYLKTTSVNKMLDFKYFDYSLHGCGDVLASAFVGEYLKCGDIEKSLINAGDFTTKAVEKTYNIRPYHTYGLNFEKLL